MIVTFFINKEIDINNIFKYGTNILKAYLERSDATEEGV
jgi:hypothetical protein